MYRTTATQLHRPEKKKGDSKENQIDDDNDDDDDESDAFAMLDVEMGPNIRCRKYSAQKTIDIDVKAEKTITE